jgi:hypothetical protein
MTKLGSKKNIPETPSPSAVLAADLDAIAEMIEKKNKDC